MPPDMLKRLVPTIPVAAMHLDGAVRGLRTQPIGIVITHADFMAHLALDRHPGGLAGRLAARGDGVHLGGGAQDQEAQHLLLRGEFDERPLDRLVAAQRLAEHHALVGVRDAAVDAELGGAAGGGSLADAVFVREGLGDGEAVVDGTENGGRGHAHVGEGDGGVVGGHVERPFEGLGFEAWRAGGDDEGSDALGTAVLAGRACEDEGVRGGVHACLPAFVAVDLVTVFAVLELDRFGACVHVCGIGSVVDLGQSEGGAELATGGERDEMIALLLGAVMVHHDHKRIVANDGVLILEIIGKRHATTVDWMRSKMVADGTHVDVGVGVFLAAILLGPSEAEEACFVRQVAGLLQKVFPFMRRKTLIVPLSTRGLPPMVEEAVVVIRVLERKDLFVDESINSLDIGLQVVREFKIHLVGHDECLAFLLCSTSLQQPEQNHAGYLPSEMNADMLDSMVRFTVEDEEKLCRGSQPCQDWRSWRGCG